MPLISSLISLRSLLSSIKRGTLLLESSRSKANIEDKDIGVRALVFRLIERVKLLESLRSVLLTLDRGLRVLIFLRLISSYRYVFRT